MGTVVYTRHADGGITVHMDDMTARRSEGRGDGDATAT